MSVSAVMFVYTNRYLAEDVVADVASELMTHFQLSKENFHRGGPLVYLPRGDYDLVHMEGAPGYLLDVQLRHPWYGVVRQSGDLLFLVRLAEWLEQHLPGSKIFYGHDINGEGFPFDATERAKITRFHRKMTYDSGRKDMTPEQMQKLQALYDE